jgi:hypothetical protein
LLPVCEEVITFLQDHPLHWQHASDLTLFQF